MRLGTCIRYGGCLMLLLMVSILAAIPLALVPWHQQRLCPQASSSSYSFLQVWKAKTMENKVTLNIIQMYSSIYSKVMHHDLDMDGGQCNPEIVDTKEEPVAVAPGTTDSLSDNVVEESNKEVDASSTNNQNEDAVKTTQGTAEERVSPRDHHGHDAKEATLTEEEASVSSRETKNEDDVTDASVLNRDTQNDPVDESTSELLAENIEAVIPEGDNEVVFNDNTQARDLLDSLNTSSAAVASCVTLQSKPAKNEEDYSIEETRAEIASMLNGTKWDRVCKSLGLKPRSKGLRNIRMGVVVESSTDVAVLPLLVHESLKMVEKIVIIEGSTAIGSCQEDSPQILRHWPRLAKMYPRVTVHRVNFDALFLVQPQEEALTLEVQSHLAFHRKQAVWNGLKEELLREATDTTGFMILNANEIVRTEGIKAAAGCSVSLPVHYSMKSYRYSLRFKEEGMWLHPEMVSYLSLKKKDPFAIRASRYQGSQFPEEGLAPVDYASTDAQTSLSIGGTSVQNAGWKLRLFGGVSLVARSIYEQLLPINKTDSLFDKIQLHAAVTMRNGDDLFAALGMCTQELSINVTSAHANVSKALEINDQGQYIVSGWNGLNGDADIPTLVKESASRWLHVLDPFG